MYKKSAKTRARLMPPRVQLADIAKSTTYRLQNLDSSKILDFKDTEHPKKYLNP
jgi:hypothetical protein